jgi:hypothetical protein
MNTKETLNPSFKSTPSNGSCNCDLRKIIIVGLSTVLRPKGTLNKQTHGQKEVIGYISRYIRPI